jgi:hypothetical protein
VSGSHKEILIVDELQPLILAVGSSHKPFLSPILCRVGFVKMMRFLNRLVKMVMTWSFVHRRLVVAVVMSLDFCILYVAFEVFV